MSQVFIYTFVYLIAWIFARKSLMEARADFQTLNRSAQHYTVLLENIPLTDNFDEQKFIDELMINKQNQGKYTIANFLFCYGINEHFQKYSEQLAIKKELTYIKCHRKTLKFRAERDKAKIEELDLVEEYPYLCSYFTTRSIFIFYSINKKRDTMKN